MTILQLPPEIFHNILVFVPPQDLGQLPLTCRFFNDFIKNNNALCRDIYLRILDDPRNIAKVDFVQELRDVVRLGNVCRSHHIASYRQDPLCARRFILEELPFVDRVVTHLLANSGHPPPRSPNAAREVRAYRAETFSPSNNSSLLRVYFNSRYSRDAFLKQSSLFARLRNDNSLSGSDFALIGHDSIPPQRRHQSAKLHCLYGITETVNDIADRRRYRLYPPTRSLARQIYGLACSKVYDLREYNRAGTAWGPFRGGDEADGQGLRVDWEKTEAILLVLGANLIEKGLSSFEGVENVWGRPFAGVWGQSYIPWTFGRLRMEKEREDERLRGGVDEVELKRREEKEELERQDPYGVTGTWLRVVCFLDYSEFLLFNFPTMGTAGDIGERPPLDTGEATRLILMKIHVTQVESTTEPGDNPDWPVVHFEGMSRALDSSWEENADSELRGTARMTKEGEVRWTTYSIYNGVEKWKSEGFQLGGVRSARGVIGNWFEKDYNDRGPCGPTSFWKVADHEYSGDDADALLSELLPHTVVDQSDEEEIDSEEEEESESESESPSPSPSLSDSDDFEGEGEEAESSHAQQQQYQQQQQLYAGLQTPPPQNHHHHHHLHRIHLHLQQLLQMQQQYYGGGDGDRSDGSDGDDEDAVVSVEEEEDGEVYGPNPMERDGEHEAEAVQAMYRAISGEPRDAARFSDMMAAQWQIGVGLANDLQNQGVDVDNHHVEEEDEDEEESYDGVYDVDDGAGYA